jgi:uncharacterized protein
MPRQVPVVDYLQLGDPPRLVAHACAACGALYFDRRNACARCFGTDFGPAVLSSTGRVRGFTIVSRAKRPFTSVVVDLDGGGVVKANLLGVDDAAQITPRMAVTLDTYVAGTDDDGTEAIAFGFRPAGEQR